MISPGEHIGRLEVLHVADGKAVSRCECGELATHSVRSLTDAKRFGRVSSCGCAQRDNLDALNERKRENDWNKGRPSPKKGRSLIDYHERAVRKYMGRKYGDLTVIDVLLPDPPGSRRKVVCRCSCGQHCEKLAFSLHADAALHCGCQHGNAIKSRVSSPQTERETHHV